MRKTAVVATGLGALACLLLVLAGISALFMGGTWRAARAEIDGESELGGRIAGPLVVWMDNREWAEAVIAAFNAHYPDVTVRMEPWATWTAARGSRWTGRPE